MDPLFPLNECWRARYGSGPWFDNWQAANRATVTIPAFGKMPTYANTPLDDVDDDCFLAAILEMEAEERKRLGVLGRWPFWELRRWRILHPEAAERLWGAGILLAGTTLGVLWHVLAGWVASR